VSQLWAGPNKDGHNAWKRQREEKKRGVYKRKKIKREIKRGLRRGGVYVYSCIQLPSCGGVVHPHWDL
jgi:hypothetical protein